MRVKRMKSSALLLAAAVLALVGAFLFPRLWAQDKSVEACRHSGGKATSRIDPDKLLERYAKSFAKPELPLIDWSRNEAQPVPWPKLPACRFEKEHEVTLKGVRLDREILIVGEDSLSRVKDLATPDRLVLFVGSPESFAKALDQPRTNWGLAPSEMLELFKVRCLPAKVWQTRDRIFHVRSISK